MVDSMMAMSAKNTATVDATLVHARLTALCVLVPTPGVM